jgi:hypothetical protein
VPIILFLPSNRSKAAGLRGGWAARSFRPEILTGSVLALARPDGPLFRECFGTTPYLVPYLRFMRIACAMKLPYRETSLEKCNTIKLCPDHLGRFGPHARKLLNPDRDSL